MNKLKSQANWMLTLVCALSLVLLTGCQQTAQPTDPAPAKKTVKAAPVSSGGIGMAYPTGDKATSAIWIEKIFPSRVELNNTFDYLIKVTNLTNLELTDVVVTDDFPANFEIASATPNYNGKDGGKVHWIYGKLAPRETKTITVKGKATSTESLFSCATVSYNSLLCARIPVVEPGLKLVKTMTSQVLSCDPILATYTVSNPGTGVSRNVVVTDNLPEGLVTADGKKTLSFNAGDLGPGASRQFTANLKGAVGEHTNTATAKAEGGLTAEASADVVVREPVLQLVQTCPEREFVGRNICNKFTVKNMGNGVAKNATLRVTLPAGAGYASSTGGTFAGGAVTFNLGNLAPDASKELEVCYRPTRQGPHKVSSSAAAYCAKQVAASCTTSIEGIPAILLEVVDVNDPVAVGKNEIYTITATNQGSAVGKNVTITATLEEEAEHVSSGGATKSTVDGKTISFAPLAELAPGAKATWRVTVKALKAGDIRFTVKMTEAQLKRPVEENEATNFFE